MSRLPTKVTTIQDKEAFLKQKSCAIGDVSPLDLNQMKKKQKSDEQLKKINEKKLGTKEVRGVEVKACL